MESVKADPSRVAVIILLYKKSLEIPVLSNVKGPYYDFYKSIQGTS
jgi:hypothetical protein